MDLALLNEVHYFLGQGDAVRARAEKILESPSVDPTVASRSALILALQRSDDGAASEALALLERALALAEEGHDIPQQCIAANALLERTYDRAVFEHSRPLAMKARRLSIRAADPQVTTTTHLTFARLEARVGHYDRAMRHFELARLCLEDDPNLWLRAAIGLDQSSLLSLLGRTEDALRLAVAATEEAVESGWSKGIVAGFANSAFFCVALGRLDGAQDYLRQADAQTYRSRRYSFALAETRAQIALLSGNLDKAEELVSDDYWLAGTLEPWYELFRRELLIRILLRRRQWAQAVEACDQARKVAAQTGAQPYLVSLRLLRVEALLGLDRPLASEDLPLELGNEDIPDVLRGRLWLSIANSLDDHRGESRAEAFRGRAVRTLTSTGNSYLLGTSGSGDGMGSTRWSDSAPADIESAVALLELGGHAHILGSEALAVVEGAGCATAAALVARGPGGLRVIGARGWDERAAAAAAALPATECIPLGQRGEETWQLLVEPRSELDHRCSLVAIRKVIQTALTLDRYRRDEKQRAALWPAESLDGDPDTIWASETMAEIVGIARRIAPTPLPVLLTGETGTGKEMLARTIHRASDRAERIFLPFNCSAVPRDMLESQLFGYRRGAFTGADAAFPGVIRSATGGTLFLDEIADISFDLQPKLLRFLETHEIHPLGEPQPVKVDVRIVAATNARLEQLVSEGRFREDLFYRLNVIRLQLPPLRERREEIPALVDHYLRRFGDEQRKGRLTLADETLEYLLLYAWPGNVRQLANEVRRMVALAEPGSALTPALLSPEIQATRRTIPAAGAADEFRVSIRQPLPEAVEALEQMMVRRALEQSQGRVEEAARLLGISRKGLFLKRRRWGMPVYHGSHSHGARAASLGLARGAPEEITGPL